MRTEALVQRASCGQPLQMQTSPNHHLNQAPQGVRVALTMPRHRHHDVDCKDRAVRAQVERMLGHEDARDRLLTRGTPPLPEVQPNSITRSLWIEAQEIWDRCQDQRPFRAFVAADYEEVYRALARLQGRLTTVLEWGSGLGVVTIMASNLGFEAYGIESEPHLVDLSRKLAQKYGPGARFVTGSFIPREYKWNPETADESMRSDVDAEPAYDDLDMELRDFDLVYAFPWPEEQALFRDILRQYGGKNSLFLTFEAREGSLLSRVRDFD